jgi:hypothetical protein
VLGAGRVDHLPGSDRLRRRTVIGAVGHG